ncbi:MAG: SanA/YdcF family protein [Candidatus Cyclobacteriaceae bacterium M3_2C_046]
MKFLKFFLSIVFWTALFAVVIILVYFQDFNEAVAAFKTINPGEPLNQFQILESYFAYADQWNKVYIVIIISILLLLFALNDYLIRWQFPHLLSRFNTFSYLTKVLRWLIQKFAVGLLVLLQFIILTNLAIVIYADPYIQTSQNVKKHSYALLLGINKKLTKVEGDNLYYYYRIEAAEQLYKSGKVDQIIISGDNHVKDYNEPGDMMRDLIKRGIPRSAFQLDFAGFRTLDSIVRLRYHFGILDDVIIISQRFHLERAIVLAHFYGIKADAYKAGGTMTFDMMKRELLAKPKALMDIFVFNMQPKYGKTTKRAPLQIVNREHIILLGITICLLFYASYQFTKSLRLEYKPINKKSGRYSRATA